ncbi:MAG: hypothetical protein AB7E85_03360 [Pseudobdellovibrionaceae bacterium]
MKDIPVTNSRFMMWRTVFALAHADEIVTEAELAFMTKTLDSYGFTPSQRKILQADMQAGTKGDPLALFAEIENPKDKTDFFTYARLILWCDGDFDAQEKTLLDKLKRTHLSAMEKEALRQEVRHLFNAEEKTELKKRIVKIHDQLSKKREQPGGFFGAVIRKMWSDTKKGA